MYYCMADIKSSRLEGPQSHTWYLSFFSTGTISAQFFSTRKSQQNRFVNKNVTRKNFQILTLFVFLEPNPYLIFVTGTTGISASVKFSNDALILLMYWCCRFTKFFSAKKGPVYYRSTLNFLVSLMSVKFTLWINMYVLSHEYDFDDDGIWWDTCFN